MALGGITVLELAGLAPVPFCGMILADFGAEVIRVDRVVPGVLSNDAFDRGKKSVAIDIKKGKDLVLQMIEKVDVLLDPFRPGMLESIGLGPDVCLQRNPRLVYARLSGFGQTGPLAKVAGHDINYLSLSGLLSRLGRSGDKPMFPHNLISDFAGGTLLCAFGILSCLLERTKSGRGQVVDASMVDGTMYFGHFLFNKHGSPLLGDRPRGENLLDGGAPFYGTYETKDGKFMAVGAIEPQFYAKMIQGLGLDSDSLPAQLDRDQWPALKKTLETTFKSKTRSEWRSIFDGTDACVTPVLELDEVAQEPNTIQRNLMMTPYDPAPAPLLSRTPALRVSADRSPEAAGKSTRAILKDRFKLLTDADIDKLASEGVILCTDSPKSKL